MHGVPPRSGIERERPEGERQGLWLHGGLCDVSSVNEAGGIGQKQAQILEIENNIMGVVNICYPKNKKHYVFLRKILQNYTGGLIYQRHQNGPFPCRSPFGFRGRGLTDR